MKKFANLLILCLLCFLIQGFIIDNKIIASNNDTIVVHINIDSVSTNFSNFLSFNIINHANNKTEGFLKLTIEHDIRGKVYEGESNKINLGKQNNYTQRFFNTTYIDSIYLNLLSAFNEVIIPGEYKITLKLLSDQKTIAEATTKYQNSSSITYGELQEDTQYIIINDLEMLPSNYTCVVTSYYPTKTQIPVIDLNKKIRDTFNEYERPYISKLFTNSDIKWYKVEVFDTNNELSFEFNSKQDKTFVINKNLIDSNTIEKPKPAVFKTDSILQPQSIPLPYLSTNGSIVSESRVSNFQHPYQTTPSSYSRLYLSPSLNVMGLPFTVDIFLTTENNSRYSMNNLSFNFDSDRYKRNIENSYKQKWGLQEQELNKNINDLNFQQNQLKLQNQKVENELLTEGIEIPDTLSIDTAGYYDLLLSYVQSYYDRKLDSINSMEVQNDYDTSYQDSLKLLEHKRKFETRRNQIITLIELVKKTKSTTDDLQKLVELQKLNQVQNPFSTTRDSFINAISEDTTLSSYQKILLSVSEFDIGIAYPYYSSFTVDGLAVKGVNMALDFNELSYHLTYGRGVRDDFTTIGFETKPTFDRNLFSFGTSYSLTKNIRLNASIHKIKDTKTDDILFNPKDNFIFSVGAEVKLFNKALWSTEFARSYYIDNYLNVVDESGNTFIYNNIFNSFNRTSIQPQNAINSNVDYQLSDETNLFVGIKRVESGYKTLGSPFLRNDFIEKEAGIKQQLFKKKINLKGFYKSNRDNLVGQKPSTNRLSGYGATLQTAFKNKPNLLLSYSPYQQGNNHTDTLLRTNNRFSIFTGTLTYFTTYKEVTTSSIITYVRSNSEFNDGTQALLNNILINERMLYKSWEVDASYISNITTPKIDTVNYNAKLTSIGYRWPNGVTTTAGGKLINYKSGAIMQEAFVGCKFRLLKEFMVDARMGYGKINGIWGFNNQDIFTGDISLSYFW